MSNLQYYAFRQNNSGGSFDYSDTITEWVIIQAYSPEDANLRAESIGIYFDGVDLDRDCPCCGDRWVCADRWDARDKPEIYGRDPGECEMVFTQEGEVFCRVFHLDGTITEYRS